MLTLSKRAQRGAAPSRARAQPRTACCAPGGAALRGAALAAALALAHAAAGIEWWSDFGGAAGAAGLLARASTAVRGLHGSGSRNSLTGSGF